jgi:hypothetical protein
MTAFYQLPRVACHQMVGGGENVIALGSIYDFGIAPDQAQPGRGHRLPLRLGFSGAS